MFSATDQKLQNAHLDTTVPAAAVSDNELDNSNISCSTNSSLFQRRNLRFHESVEIIPTSSPFDEADAPAWDTIWYQRDELHAMRTQAKDLHQKMMKDVKAVQQQQQRQQQPRAVLKDVVEQPQVASDNGESQHVVYSFALDHDNTRGLEQLFCFERPRRKYITTKFIVNTQKRNDVSEEKLAHLARRLNQWATELAIDDARSDYKHAYPATATTTEKRALNDVDDDDEEWTRRVRSRVL